MWKWMFHLRDPGLQSSHHDEYWYHLQISLLFQTLRTSWKLPWNKKSTLCIFQMWEQRQRTWDSSLHLRLRKKWGRREAVRGVFELLSWFLLWGQLSSHAACSPLALRRKLRFSCPLPVPAVGTAPGCPRPPGTAPPTPTVKIHHEIGGGCLQIGVAFSGAYSNGEAVLARDSGWFGGYE